MTELVAEGLDYKDVAAFGYHAERWNFVEGEAMTGIIAKLNKEQSRYVLSLHSSRVVWRTLLFYPGATLVRVTDLAWRPSGMTLYFVGLRGQYRRLDGSRRLLQFLNDKIPLKLTPQNVADYLRFYSYFVRSHGRPFLLVDTLEDLGHFIKPLTAEQQDAAKAALHPITITSETADGFELSATVRYANALFDCRFSVSPTGAVRMLEEKEIPLGLPGYLGQSDATAWA